ncbi:hypothetical protein [Splendidivirga corallicola]
MTDQDLKIVVVIPNESTYDSGGKKQKGGLSKTSLPKQFEENLS